MHTCGVVSLLLVLLLNGCSSVSNDDELDPYDMENFDPSSNSMNGKVKKDPDKPNVDTSQSVEEKIPTKPVVEEEKSETPNNKENNTGVCRQDSSPCPSLFRQFVKTLLYHVKGKVYAGAEELNLRLKMTESDVEYLETFTDSTGADKDVRHVHEVLSSMIQLASEVQPGDPTVNRLWFESLFGMPLEKLVMLAALVSMLGLIFGAANMFHFSWKKLAVKMVFFLFVISTFWQWYELYKKEEARQHMNIMKDMPKECRKREKEESLIIMKTIFLSLRSMVSFDDDQCLKYYEHMLIDPFWRVTPTQAFSKTVVRFFLSPAREIGEAIQELLTGTLKGLPVQLWPVALGFIGVFSFLLLFMSFGYRFSLPFIAIETGKRADNSNILKEMEKQHEQLQESHRREMKQLQETMKQVQEDHLQKLLALPGIKDEIINQRQRPSTQAQGRLTLKGPEVLSTSLALQESGTETGSHMALSGSRAVPKSNSFRESHSLQHCSSLDTSKERAKAAMSSKSAPVINESDGEVITNVFENIKDSEQNMNDVPEMCSSENVVEVDSCVELLDAKSDSTDSLKTKKDLDVTGEEKGLMFNTNLSGQSESFEEISVSNIEAIGKRD